MVQRIAGRNILLQGRKCEWSILGTKEKLSTQKLTLLSAFYLSLFFCIPGVVKLELPARRPAFTLTKRQGRPEVRLRWSNVDC